MSKEIKALIASLEEASNNARTAAGTACGKDFADPFEVYSLVKLSISLEQQARSVRRRYVSEVV